MRAISRFGVPGVRAVYGAALFRVTEPARSCGVRYHSSAMMHGMRPRMHVQLRTRGIACVLRSACRHVSRYVHRHVSEEYVYLRARAGDEFIRVYREPGLPMFRCMPHRIRRARDRVPEPWSRRLYPIGVHSARCSRFRKPRRPRARFGAVRFRTLRRRLVSSGTEA